MSTSGTATSPPPTENTPTSAPTPQTSASPAGQSGVEGVTPAAGAATEVRLVGGRPATRLAHSPPHLIRDDGYCSSDSTPKATGLDVESRVGLVI
ncbi:hypothetical protein Pmani_034639 [Petrolisthes manimaculis]|uniref:Uncharacterized protein n=1 Tax=Petrolisthes manimaculis TaxID=1843537 RepID=A0AAE1NMC7_9EUCA|nr:hypothetical protein Pmani_034639 [Petrolisthes manimaculis]